MSAAADTREPPLRGARDEDRTRGAVLVQGRHFFYNHDFSVRAFKEDGGSVNSDYVEFEKHVGEWAVFSYGPDRIYYNEPPGGTAHTRGQFLNYDATNGTTSRGNIIMCQKNGERAGPVAGYAYR